MVSDILKLYEEIIKSETEPVSGISTVVVKNKKIIGELSAGYSYINSKDSSKNIKMVTTTYFRVASVSKVITAVAVMQLFEKNQIDLDADISEYLGFRLRNPQYPDIVINAKMLLSHMSGLNDSNGYNININESIEDFLNRNPSSFSKRKPGEYFLYCNLGFILLGAVIENISGERFDLYIKKHIMEPMNLQASFNVNDLDINLGTCYRLKNGIWTATKDNYRETEERLVLPADYKLGKNPSVFGPQGSLRISCHELAEIMIMFMNGGIYNNRKILDKSSIELMFKPNFSYDDNLKNGDTYEGLILSYGLGTHQLTNTYKCDKLSDKRDLYYAGHHGDAYGLLSMFFFDFKTEEGFVSIINGIGFDEYEKEHLSPFSAFRKPEQAIVNIIFDYFL